MSAAPNPYPYPAAQSLGVSRELREAGFGLMCVGFPRSDLVLETVEEDEVYDLQFGRSFAEQARSTHPFIWAESGSARLAGLARRRPAAGTHRVCGLQLGSSFAGQAPKDHDNRLDPCWGPWRGTLPCSRGCLAENACPRILCHTRCRQRTLF